MKTLTRKEGRKVYTCDTFAEVVTAFREMLAEGAFAKVNDEMVDTFTASIVVQVFEALSDENLVKLEAMFARLTAKAGGKVALRGVVAVLMKAVKT